MLAIVQDIDVALVEALNQASRKSFLLDTFVTRVLLLPSVKMLPIVLLLVYAGARKTWQWDLVVRPLTGAFLTLMLTRVMQNLMPARPRPMHGGVPDFVLPIGMPPETLSNWSSFPSDTTALAFALATGVWLLSRPLGALAYLWAALFVGLPRIYVGFHYASDIVAGAAIGVAATLLVSALWERRPMLVTAWWTDHPRLRPLFCTLVFAVLFQTVMMFEDIRIVGRILAEILSS